MADIAPFRGLRYNPEQFTELNSVLTPPYDVISPEEQKAFHDASPHSMIHLELGMKKEGDGSADNPHLRAGRLLREWREQGVLIRDDQPCIYYYELDYPLPGGVTKTRRGFLCLIRLEEFGQGVRPHEKTFQAVKDERLGLITACPANLSPIFAVYPDPEHGVDAALREGREKSPLYQVHGLRDTSHRLWRVTDAGALDRARQLMRDKVIFIADGHHRYETALKYRSIRREQSGDTGTAAPYDYVMVYLSDMDEDGLTILPTHRLLRNLDGVDMDGFVNGCEPFFNVTRYPAGDGVSAPWVAELAEAGRRRETAIAFFGRGANEVALLTAKKEPVERYLRDQGVNEVLRNMDVVILDRLVLQNIMGLSSEFLHNSENIQFEHEATAAMNRVRTGVNDAAFLINATRIDQVRTVAEAGHTMPHKATYFFPKVTSGMVIHPIEEGETVAV